eukprot:635110-Amphidinium_carterae.3
MPFSLPLVRFPSKLLQMLASKPSTPLSQALTPALPVPQIPSRKPLAHAPLQRLRHPFRQSSAHASAAPIYSLFCVRLWRPT